MKEDIKRYFNHRGRESDRKKIILKNLNEEKERNKAERERQRHIRI